MRSLLNGDTPPMAFPPNSGSGGHPMRSGHAPGFSLRAAHRGANGAITSTAMHARGSVAIRAAVATAIAAAVAAIAIAAIVSGH